MVIRLVALKRVLYPRGGTDAKEYQPGEQFDALSERDAKALKLIGKAKDAPVAAAAAAPAAAVETSEQPQRRYRRRDLTAEGD